MNRALTRCAAALALAAALAAGCASPARKATTSDAELARLSSAARKAFDAGAPDKAVPLFTQALDRARALDDAAALASVAYNLAACRLETADLDGADRAAAEAEDSAVRAGIPADAIILLRGRIALARGDAKAAGELARRIPAGKAKPDKAMRAAAGLLRADAELALKDLPGTRLAVSEVRKLLTPSSAPALRAATDEAEARLLLAEDQPSAAADLFERAAAGRSEANQSAHVPLLLGRAAEAREAAGDKAAAADCAYRAGRACAGLGRSDEALNWLQTARRLNQGQTDGATLDALVNALERELAARKDAAVAPR